MQKKYTIAEHNFRPYVYVSKLNFPLGGMTEAFMVGVHLNLIDYVKISLTRTETFFFIWKVGCGWCASFWKKHNHNQTHHYQQNAVCVRDFL